MRDKIKVSAIGKVIHRNRFVNRVGIYTDAMIILIDNLKEFPMFKPRIFKKKNILFINYIVFSELVEYFVFNKKYKRD